jgi:pilus assembly protein CpaE
MPSSMAHGLRIILFNTEEGEGSSLRGSLLKFPDTKIVAEVDDPASLRQAVNQIPAHLVVVNLDPLPETMLPIAGEVASERSDLAVFAVSDSTDGALILSAMRLGLKEFLTKPIDSAVLGEALERISTRFNSEERQGSLISIVGGAGGVGATMLATNLAIELATLRRDVCLVDLDYRFGQVGTLLDVEPAFSIADLCDTPERLEQQVVDKALVKHASGVRVLCRPVSFAQADTITAAHCVGALTALLSSFPYVVVDGPSRLDPGAKSVLDISDRILLVLELLVPDVRNVQRMLDGMRAAGFNLDRITLVCNRVGKYSANLSVADVESTLGLEIFSALPDDWAAVSSSINLGEPLSVSHPRSRIRQAIQELARQLYSPGDNGELGGDRKSGLLSKIFQ